jgi:hypothetical protein
MILSRARCFNHPEREAVARCPECGRHFCRECVNEHEDRLLCAFCLDRLLAAPGFRRRSLGRSVPVVQAFLGFLFLWLSCYLLGRLLIAIPSSFHELGMPPGGIGP